MLSHFEPPDLQAVANLGLGGGYASIDAVLLSKRIVDAINGAMGWKHSYTYQVHPLACGLARGAEGGSWRGRGPKMGVLLHVVLVGRRSMLRYRS